MSTILYLLKRSIINYFKKLKSKPQSLIVLIPIICMIIMMAIPSKSSSYNPKTAMSPQVFISVALLIFLLIILYALYHSTKKVNSVFDMCDVKFLFTSPIKPQTVLLYGVVKQIAVELLGSVYIVYQIPNFLRHENIPSLNQILLIVSFLVFQVIFCNVLKLFIFAINTKYKSVGPAIRSSIKALGIIVIIPIIFAFTKGNGENILKSAANGVTYSSWLKFVPVIGWIKEILYQTYFGLKWTYLIYVLLIIAISGVLLFITYNINIDFYEQMLDSAEEKESKIEKAAVRYIKPLRKKELKLDGVYGAKVLFYKQVNEMQKRSIVFFVNFYSIFLLAASILLGIVAKKIDINVILIISGGLLFFSSGLGGKIYIEIENSFIYLLPDEPIKKLFYGVLSSAIKIFSDSLLIFIPFGVLSHKSAIQIVFCIIVYSLLGMMLSYSGLFAFRICEFLGFTGPIASGFSVLILQMLLVAIAAVIVFLTSKWIYAFYFSLIIYSLVMGIMFAFLVKGRLNQKEV